MSGAVKISEAASLALHAMVLMAAIPERFLPAKEIAATFKISSAHLAKVMQRLVRAGLVSSSRGPAGGFTLARPSQEITLLEIYEAIEGALSQEGCLLAKEVCPGSACLLGDIICDVNETFRKGLASKTLAALARSYLTRAPLAKAM